MIDELECVTELRPAVPAAQEEVRAQARAQLERAIAAAPAADPTGLAGRRPNPFARLRWTAPAVAALVAIAIAGGAILLVHHRQPTSTAASGSGARGRIVDRNGNVLVESRYAVDLRFDTRTRLTRTQRSTFAALLRLDDHPDACTVRAGTSGAHPRSACPAAARGQSVMTLQTLTRRASHGVAAYVSRHRAQLPGVSVRSRWVRVFPNGALAPQVLSGGLQYEYRRILRAGDTLKVSIDSKLQRAGQHALAVAIAANRSATGGAFVALNPENGQVLAMGSAPTYDAMVLSEPTSDGALSQLTSPNAGAPLINRAIASTGPVGSAFTPFTAIAALESGTWNINSTYDDTGIFCVGRSCYHNSGNATYGVVNVVAALRVSDGLFFDNLGALMNTNRPAGGPLQEWARQFGFGESSGIDLPGALAGAVPSPGWTEAQNRLEDECQNATGPFAGHYKHASCGISDGKPWSLARNVDLAAGQGDLQTSPLQLAVAYAALANGGNVVTPHVGLDIQAPDGALLAQIDPPIKRRLDIDPDYLDHVLKGLRETSSAPGGTTADVFGNFPEPVYGKAGTAQYLEGGRAADYAWYAGFVPATDTGKPIVVVVTVEHGGFGAVSAAPVARRILSQWFLGTPGPWRPGTSTTL